MYNRRQLACTWVNLYTFARLQHNYVLLLYLLGGDTVVPSGLYARLCHVFLVSYTSLVFVITGYMIWVSFNLQLARTLTYPVMCAFPLFSARCNIYISRLSYDVSVRLSVTFVHCGHRVQWIPDIFACLDRWMSLLLTDNA